jgi:4-diphosphocytidyl-2-C-methyl-D-erythritol kinase
VLVNPRLPVETPAVFKALGLRPGQAQDHAAHPAIAENGGDAFLKLLSDARNDLEPPARTVQPVIDEVLGLTAALPGCRLARMSGSGATVFGLFDNCDRAAAAAKALRSQRPAWWVKATSLR